MSGKGLSGLSSVELSMLRYSLSCSIDKLQQELDNRMRWQRNPLLPDATRVDPGAVYDWIAQTALTIFDCQQVSLMVFYPDTEELVVRSAIGHADMARALGASQKLGEGVAGWVAKRQDALILGPKVQPGQFKNFQIKVHPIAAAMIVPLLLGDRLTGVLNVSSRSSNASYSKNDLESLRFLAQVAATYCHQAREIEWMTETLEKLDAVLQTEKLDFLRKTA